MESVKGLALLQKRTVKCDKVIFKATIRHRQDVKGRIDDRRGHRRFRRSNIRYREPRFDNRRRTDGWIPPSIRSRKDDTVRVLKDLQTICPLTFPTIEQGMFDVASLSTGKELVGKEYQQGIGYGWDNRRQAVLFRDNYICQYCGEKSGVMTVDHIIPRSRGGTDTWSNLVCACFKCNELKGDKTAAEFGYPKIVGGQFKYPAILMSGKTYICLELCRIFGDIKIVYGWQTKQWRKALGLDKTHYNDAIAIGTQGNKYRDCANRIYYIKPRQRQIRKINDPCQIKNHSIGSFFHGDIVVGYKSSKKYYGAIVSIKTRGEITLALSNDTQEPNFSKNKIWLLYRPRGIIYIPVGPECNKD